MIFRARLQTCAPFAHHRSHGKDDPGGPMLCEWKSLGNASRKRRLASGFS
jgi:hypothetical protein